MYFWSMFLLVITVTHRQFIPLLTDVACNDSFTHNAFPVGLLTTLAWPHSTMNHRTVSGAWRASVATFHDEPLYRVGILESNCSVSQYLSHSCLYGSCINGRMRGFKSTCRQLTGRRNIPAIVDEYSCRQTVK